MPPDIRGCGRSWPGFGKRPRRFAAAYLIAITGHLIGRSLRAADCSAVQAPLPSICRKNRSSRTKHEFDGLLLAGPDRLTQAVQEKIPYPLRNAVVVIHENLGRTSPRELQRLQPLIDHYEQEQQMSEVKLLQASNRTAVTNPDEVSAQFQNGRIRAPVVAHDLELALRQCPKCGLANSSADRVCATCGTVRQKITLIDLLAQGLNDGNVQVEFVGGAAERLLRRTGGLGGWLATRRAVMAR